MTKPLTGKIAVVAGATRGAGRGIARMLGEAGATVYCSGRSVAGQPATKNRPETIDETAELVTAAGGRGIAVQTDHLQADQVRAPVRARQAGVRPPRHPRQRHLGRRRPHRVGHEVLGARSGQGLRHPRQRGAHAHPDQPLRRAADDRAEVGAGGRDHRRRPPRLSRRALLRPGQDGRHPARVRHGRGARRARASRRWR